MNDGLDLLRRVAIALGTLCCVIVLTGCAPDRGILMSPEEMSGRYTGGEEIPIGPATAKAQTVALLEGVQELVGGQWKREDSGATDCGLPGGEVGARHALTRRGPGLPEESIPAVAETVAELWGDAGYESVTSRVYIGDLTAPLGLKVKSPAEGWHANGSFLAFQVTMHGSNLQAYTPCAPGDAAELNRIRHENKLRDELNKNMPGWRQ